MIYTGFQDPPQHDILVSASVVLLLQRLGDKDKAVTLHIFTNMKYFLHFTALLLYMQELLSIMP